MEQITYTQQFNKITEAYIMDEIKPFDPKFCFCGTLCDQDTDWFYRGNIEKILFGYSGVELKLMEQALLETINNQTYTTEDYFDYCGNNDGELKENHPNFETALFNGMVAALEVLKQIHIERGEVIDEEPVFKKRNLVTA